MERIIMLVATLLNIGVVTLLAIRNNKQYKNSIFTLQLMKEAIEASQQNSELQFKSFTFFMNFIIDLKHYELISLRRALIRQLENEQKQEHYEACRYIAEAIKHIDCIQNNYKHEQKPQN